MSERLKPPQPDNITPKTGASFDTTPQISEEPADELELTSQEQKQRAYQEKTAERYDELLQEREDLRKQLVNYDPRINSPLFLEGMLPDSKVRKICSQWLQTVREQTEFLKPLDDLGIKIFTDNLADQPNFPDIKITFESAKIAREKTAELNNMGGMAEIKEVHVGSKNFDLRHQLINFLQEGKLDDTTTVLIHELIHCYHNSSEYVDAELTEAQAYWSGVLAGKFSLVDTLKILTIPAKEGGLYEFEQEKITKILLCVTTLNGLGKSEKEVADLIKITKYDPNKNKFSPLEDKLDQLMEANGLDEIDAQAAHDLYRLHVTNQRKKALLILDKMIEKNVNKKERLSLDKKRIHNFQSNFGMPSYYNAQGERLKWEEIPEGNYQFTFTPNTKDFPYTFNGRRTCITFGLFYNVTKKMPEFEIGRFEALGNKSKIEPATTTEEKNKLVDIMKENAKLINFNAKKRLLLAAVETGKLFFEDEIAKKVLNIFISPSEAKEILDGQQYAENFLNVYDGMKADKMNEYKFEEYFEDKWKKKIKAYTPMVESYLEYLKIFNLKIDELSPAIAVPLKSIMVWLKNCRDILDKNTKSPTPVGLE